jgi:hypothetical protein
MGVRCGFIPVKDADSRRWHVHTTQGDFEILTTGLKWYDTRARKGGAVRSTWQCIYSGSHSRMRSSI